jgi:hypothetical protein
VRRIPIAPIVGAFFDITTRVPLFNLAVLLWARGRMNRLVWTPYPFPRGVTEADLCDGPYFMIEGHSHGAAI